MRLLYVIPRFPYPPLRGDQNVPYHRLRLLGSRHEISVLGFYENEAQLEHISELERHCERVELVRLPARRSVANMLAHGPVSRLPFQVLYYRSRAFSARLDRLLAEGHFDVVNGFMLRVAPYLDRVAVPTVLDVMDSMQLRFERYVQIERGPKRWAYAEELRRVRRLERAAAARYDRLVVVAEQDRPFFPGENVSVIPLGVDTDEFFPGREARPGRLIFSGNMGYAPNVAAVRWFVEYCLPLVRAQLPETELVIAGARPSPEVRALAGPGVTVTGFVDSIADALRASSIAVTPMQSGSGMQNKILEAMACGVPVVTTRLGLGSIEARPDEVVLAESPADTAAAVVELLRDPARARELGRRGRERVLASYSWERNARSAEELYEALAEGRHA